MVSLRISLATRLALVFVLVVAFGAARLSGQQPAPEPDPPELTPLTSSGDGHTAHGDWHADVTLSRDTWSPGLDVKIVVTLRFADTHLASLTGAGIKADKLCVLATAERTFDADGWMRLASDERMSTLLTPTGLAIEGA